MQLSTTSGTLFLLEAATFLVGVIVIVCNGLYLSSYPHSPTPSSVSAIACATLAFAVLSTLLTLLLMIRQKHGRTLPAAVESTWAVLSGGIWIAAAVGGILQPANGMNHLACNTLSDGQTTDDKNFQRACQSIFASTAFCIVSALLFFATAILLMVYSVKRSGRGRKVFKGQVGGHYQLGPSPSQYRRSERANKRAKGVEEEESQGLTAAPTDSTDDGQHDHLPLQEGHFSENMYQDPVMTVQPAMLGGRGARVGTEGLVHSYNSYGDYSHAPSQDHYNYGQ